MGKDYKFSLKKGNPNILGVTQEGEAFNFAVDVPDDKDISLLVYEKGGQEPAQEIPLGEPCRTGNVYTLRILGLDPENHAYNYRIGGQVVQDPCACVLYGLGKFGELPDPAAPHYVRCGLPPQDPPGWEDDRPLMLPYEETILYKVHVRGYTMHKNSKARRKGTFAGLQEKIPYWKELGVTSLELMPAYEFREIMLPENMPLEYAYKMKEPFPVNFWGYTDGYYYAPKAAYSYSQEPVSELRGLVRALHAAGMECIMEFYFPKGYHPSQIQAILRHWRLQYHIDGFHLAGRDIPITLLGRDPLLSRTKLIAQCVDGGAIYGNKIPSCKNLAECHEGFKEDMRRWLKGDEDSLGAAIYRMRRNPDTHAVVNYMVNQDGFTLQDMVSYGSKHNEANGENNQDGPACNYSWNCGVEGPTRKKAVRELRACQARNAFLMLLLSQGVPLLYGGDEFGNSQQGNNNAYCQDNEIGWVDWGRAKSSQSLTNFVKEAIAFRKNHKVLHMPQEPKGTDYRSLGFPDISYHSRRAWYENLEPASRQIGIMYYEGYGQDDGSPSGFLYLACNLHWKRQRLALPHLPDGMQWRVALKSCGDGGPERTWIAEDETEMLKYVLVPARTILVLSGEPAPPPAQTEVISL